MWNQWLEIKFRSDKCAGGTEILNSPKLPVEALFKQQKHSMHCKTEENSTWSLPETESVVLWN